jgi:sugar phosphate isomerase/epimerase
VEMVARVGRENFGLQYDPANLFEAEEEYGEASIRRLGPSIRQLSVQSMRRARPEEPHVWEHAGRFFLRCLLDEPGGVNYVKVMRGLRAIGFDGTVTVNEPRPALMATPAFARRMRDDLHAML